MSPGAQPAHVAPDGVAAEAVDAFVERWRGAQAAEIANAQSFVIELCELLGLPRPEPATKDPARDAYVFERPVAFQDAASAAGGRIDLYRRGCFVLETKQGVDADNAARDAGTGRSRSAGHGTRGSAAWDRTMAAAKRQAERYARNLDLPDGHTEPVPPLVVACDVGHCLDLYANFGHPQRYVPFPDNASFRIPLGDLRRPEVRERLRLAWTDPHSLDPSRRQAQVTRALAATLAELAASLEADGAAPDAVFGFLSRCLFTMFAEDAALIPERSFSGLLRGYHDHLNVLPDALESLWATMDRGGYAPDLKATLRRFNGSLFKDTAALPLTAAQLDLLLAAASADWREVEPAIFGTLLERALDPAERHTLGAHYTPRAYVERLVGPAVVDPLRDEWEAAQAAVAQIEADAEARRPAGPTARDAHDRATRRAAVAELRRYLGRLTSVRILDPACGSGNFLYVTLEHLKRIEGEVGAALARYGVSGLDLDGAAVTPRQLLGIEVNPRAAAIADLVLWIGYLQWHLRTHGGPQGLSDPVLQAYGNIECRDAVLAFDARTPRLDADGVPVTAWDGRTTRLNSTTGRQVPDTSAQRPVYDYADARPAEWPRADFIVGNPPFTGGWRVRQEQGDGYVEALWKAYPHVPQKADFVMVWWDKAAEAVRDGAAERFGLITTNSASQVFQKRVIERHVDAKDAPLRLVFAVADHPWDDAPIDGAGTTEAAVRVAMTVGARSTDGGRATVGRAEPDGSLRIEPAARIHADLSVGVDIGAAGPLRANRGVSSPGVQLYGDGFVLTPAERDAVVRGLDPETAARVVRPYLNGRDLMGTPRGASVVDFFGLTADEAAEAAPAAYQRVLDLVKPERDQNRRAAIRDAWWRFGWERPRWREMTAGLDRYVATAETAKHRVFVFLPASVLPDNMLTGVATDDAFDLGVLSSRIHEVWSLAAGGRLGVGNDPRYTKTKTFEPFPFPAATEEQKAGIRTIAEALNAHRVRVRQDAAPTLTLTALYNALAAARAGRALPDDLRDVYDRGLVGRLRELHDRLDAAVAEAYGWPAALADQEILARLVALNAERQAEEAAGLVRYLRPAFQAPGATTQAALDVATPDAATAAIEPEPWPAETAARALALRRILRDAGGPLSVEAVARRFARAPRAAVADLLDTLASLGQARAVDSNTYAS